MTTNCGRGSPALPLAADPVGKLTLHLRGAEPQHWCVLVSLPSCHLLALHVMSVGSSGFVAPVLQLTPTIRLLAVKDCLVYISSPHVIAISFCVGCWGQTGEHAWNAAKEVEGIDAVSVH